MQHTESLDRTIALAEQLPFSLDDLTAVNACFRSWKISRTEEDKRSIDLWAYCFVTRYLLARLINVRNVSDVDYDFLVTKTYLKIHRTMETVRNPDRFVAWVCRVSRNTYLNFLRDRKNTLELNAAAMVAEPNSDPSRGFDYSVVFLLLEGAIGRLPSHLKATAEMRFLYDRGYDYISQQLGLPVPSVRSYVNKIRKLLSTDPDLMALRWKE